MSFTQKLMATQFNMANGQLEGGGDAYLARGLAGVRISSTRAARRKHALSSHLWLAVACHEPAFDCAYASVQDVQQWHYR
jgi:hypothetical protein